MDGRILVPFGVESSLSGVSRVVGPDNRLWYRRAFRLPSAWAGQRGVRVPSSLPGTRWETAENPP